MRCWVFILLLSSLNVVAQEDESVDCPETESKEAKKNYLKGTDKNKYNKQERLSYLRKALELDEDYVQANFAYAQELIRTLTADNKPYQPAESYFLKVIEHCPHYHSNPYYYMGFSLYEQGRFLDANKYLDTFIVFYDDDEKKFDRKYEAFLGQAKLMKKFGLAYDELDNSTVPFDPEPVAGISTIGNEYLASISPDDQMMLFTRTMPMDNKGQVWSTDQEREMFSKSKRKSDGTFEKGRPMMPPFNQGMNEGGPSISINNKDLYFTICQDEGGAQLNCDIFHTHYVNSEWSEIERLGNKVNDPAYWDSQPSISADGKTLFFVSDRPGGYGGADLWKTEKNPVSGEWGPPINLGPMINTPGHEKTPFMHSDSETLYFSSDGHIGVGGMDIFYVRKEDNGEWGEPKNIGKPINTDKDDIGFFVSTDGKLGYFCTDERSKVNGKGVGGWDLYSFPLYEKAKPSKVAFVKGQVKDEAGQVMKDAKVEIKSTSTKEEIGVVMDTASGNFVAVVNLKKHDEIIITTKKKGHAFNSQVLEVKEAEFGKETAKPIKLDFKVEEIKPNKAYKINNLNYAVGSADLESKSEIVIDEFVEFMKENPSVKIEIHGHTDNLGNPKDNQALSYERACNVRALLEKKGVSGTRLGDCKGFGSSKPIASNDTEKGRAQNRRTEFKIISN